MKVVVVRQTPHTTTSNDLPSISEVLDKLNNALTVLEALGLDHAETLRLRKIIQGLKTYRELFVDYAPKTVIKTGLKETYEWILENRDNIEKVFLSSGAELEIEMPPCV